MRRKNYNPLLKSYPDSVLINSVSEGAELLYVRLIAQSDDAGRYWGCPKLVAAKLFSHRFANEEVTVKDISGRISELNSVGLVRLYEVNRQRYLLMIDAYKQLRKDIAAVIVFPGPEEADAPVKTAIPPHPCRPRVNDVPATQPNPTHPTPTQPSKKRKRFDLNKLLMQEFPELAAVSGFVQAWSDWARYRQELGKKLTQSTARSQLKNKARPWGPIAFMEAISNSIENGWTGIFPPNKGQGHSAAGRPRASSAIEDFLDVGKPSENDPRIVDID
jgi:hypothetical protein